MRRLHLLRRHPRLWISRALVLASKGGLGAAAGLSATACFVSVGFYPFHSSMASPLPPSTPSSCTTTSSTTTPLSSASPPRQHQSPPFLLISENESLVEGVRVRMLSQGDVTSHPHRVGGHPIFMYEESGDQLEESREGHESAPSIKRRRRRRILKPLIRGVRGERELQFYKDVRHSPILRDIVPEFHGIATIDGKMFLELEDLTAGFVLPCIIDIKIGRRTWGPDASAAKIRSALQKYRYQSHVGFRIVGIRRPEKSAIEPSLSPAEASVPMAAAATPLPSYHYVVYPKKFGRKLTPENVGSVGLSSFIPMPSCDGDENSDRSASSKAVIAQAIDKLRDMSARLEIGGGKHRLYSSSVLIVYEGYRPDDQKTKSSTDNDNSTTLSRKPLSEPLPPPRVEVKLIDFAHAHPPTDGSPRDDDFLFGLHSLISHMSSLLESGDRK